MTREKIQVNTEKAHEFEISDTRVDELLAFLNQIKDMEKLKISENIQKINKDAVVDVITSLKKALEERLKVLQDLENGRGDDTDLTTVRLTISKIKKELEQDLDSDSNKLIKFTIPNRTIDVYPELIDKARKIGSTDALETYIRQLTEARTEREKVLKNMAENEGSEFLNENGEVLTESDLQQSIDKINEILESTGEVIEKKVEPTPEIIHTTGPKEGVATVIPTPKRPKTDIEQLDSKYDFKISDVQIKELLDDLRRFESMEVETDKFLDSDKAAAVAERNRIIKQLDDAAAERESVLNILNSKPKTMYQNSFGEGLYIPQLEAVIAEIDAATDKHFEDSPSKPTPSPVQKEEKTKNIPVEFFTTINPEINLYSETLDREVTADAISQITSFIATQREKISKRRKEIEGAKVADLNSKEYRAMTAALKKLNDLETKLDSKTMKTKEIPEQPTEEEKITSPALTEEQTASLQPGATNRDSLGNAIHKKLGGSQELSFEDEEETVPEPGTENTKEETEPENNSPEFTYFNLAANLSPERIDILKTDPILFSNLTEAIADYNKALDENLDDDRKQDLWDEVELFKAMFLKYEKEFKKNKKVLTKTNTSLDREDSFGYNRIALGDPEDPFYISPENRSIMEKNGFIFEVAKAVNEYNALIDSNSAEWDIFNAFKKIQSLRSQFNNNISGNDKQSEGKKLAVHQLSDKYWDAADFDKYTQKNSDKVSSSIDAYHDNDFEDMDAGENHLHKNGTPTKKEKRAKAAKNTPPQPVTGPENQPTDTEPEKEEDIRIFYTEEGKDYTEIAEDKKFNSWLDGMTKSIKNEGISLEKEIQSLDEWYAEYQDALPYKEKLDTLYHDIKRTEGTEAIKLLTAHLKIEDLLYSIHKEGDAGRERIDLIFEKYTATKKQAEEIERLKKSAELLDNIHTQRNKGGKVRGLKPDEIETILKTRGDENLEENIDDMILFLEDMNSNYSFYSNKNENVDDDLELVYRKYRSSQGKAIRENKDGDKVVTKMGYFRKLIPRLKASWPMNYDAIDLSNKISLIKKVRELNLVDRKNGNKEEGEANKDRMADLIRFCKGQKQLLIEHIRNPKSKKEEELDNKEKELLALFDTMLKTYSLTKYGGSEATNKAEEILAKRTLGEKITTPEDQTSTIETLFDDEFEVEQFETQATIEVYREALTTLNTEISNFPKSGKEIKARLINLSTKFDEIKRVLEENGDTESELILKTTNLKIEELRLKHINKNTYKDLSSGLPILDRIIDSPDVTNERKSEHVKEFLAALKKHRENKANTTIQNAVLDDTITRYTKILETIK